MFRLARIFPNSVRARAFSTGVNTPPTCKLCRPFPSGFKSIVTPQMCELKKAFRGEGRIITVVPHSDHTRIDVFDVKQKVAIADRKGTGICDVTEFGVEIPSVKNERELLEKFLPKLDKFLTCIHIEMETDFKMYECMPESIKTEIRNIFELPKMEDREHEFNNCLKEIKDHIGSLAIWSSAICEIIENDSVAKIREMDKKFVNGEVLTNVPICQYLNTMLNFISKINNCLDWIAFAEKGILQCEIKYDQTASKLIPYIHDVFEDYTVIMHLVNEDLTTSGKRVADVRLAQTSLRKDMLEIEKMIRILQDRNLTYDENWQMFHLTEKWAGYIEKFSTPKTH